jgi:all-trans-retinol dehydrogenase (NAD+)
VRYHLTGQRVLITGGASGLGRLLALKAAARGAHVVIWDLAEAGGQATAEEITSSGGIATAMTVDVADREEVRQAAQRCGNVDVLINNAGVINGQRLLETSEDQISETLNVNTLALFWVTRAFLDGMISRGHGAVVTVASSAGLVGVPGLTDYAASKFAAFGFAEALRGELSQDRTGVTSLTVCPSHLDTAQFDGVSTRFPQLLPRLSASRVAEKILRGIERQRSQLIMPPLARTIPVARAMNVRHFDRMMAFFGTGTAMDAFRGRQALSGNATPHPGL